MSFLRRDVLVGAGALAATGLLPLAGSRGQPVRTRYDARSAQGRAMLQIYARAVQAMKAGTKARADSWTFQWYTHAVGGGTKPNELNTIFGPAVSPLKTLADETWSTCRAHFGGAGMEPSFLPWHRAFVLVFERMVRQAAGDDTFTLPYWNYIADASIPPEFRSNAGQTASLWKGDRNSWVNTGTPVNQGQAGLDLSVLGKLRYNPWFFDTIAGFNDALDNGLHGNVHFWVGGNQNMGTIPFAASDPIFWLHHAMIDRLWAAWNHSGGANPTDAAWSNVNHAFADPAGNRITYTNAQLTSTAGLFYQYDTLPQPLVALDRPEKVAAEPTQPVLVASAREVKLTGRTTSVDLKPNGTPSVGGRLFLVISKLSTNQTPGVVYSVTLPPSDKTIGTLQFFNQTVAGSADVPFRYELTTTAIPTKIAFTAGSTPDPKAAPVLGAIDVYQSK